MSRCKSCGASVIWVRLASGKAMCLDTDSEQLVRELSGGPVRGVTGDGRVIAGEPGGDEPGAVLVWRSHFATCPNAQGHRKRS